MILESTASAVGFRQSEENLSSGYMVVYQTGFGPNVPYVKPSSQRNQNLSAYFDE